MNDRGIIRTPDIRFLERNKYYFTLDINEHGFRGQEWSLKKLKNEKRVFLLGGSTAFSMFADEKNSIHNQLNYKLNKLNKNKKIHYKVFSAAAPGTVATEEYGILVSELINYKPDIIIDMNGWNNAGKYNIEQNYSIPKKITRREIKL